MPQPSKGKAPERGAPASAPAPFPFDEALNDLMQVVAGKTCPNRHSEMRVGTRPHRSPSPSIDFDPQQLPLDSPLDAQLLPRSGSHYGVVDSTTLTHIASALSRTRREAARRDACTLARTECRECLRGSERMGRRDQKEVPQRQCRHHRKAGLLDGAQLGASSVWDFERCSKNQPTLARRENVVRAAVVVRI